MLVNPLAIFCSSVNCLPTASLHEYYTMIALSVIIYTTRYWCTQAFYAHRSNKVLKWTLYIIPYLCLWTPALIYNTFTYHCLRPFRFKDLLWNGVILINSLMYVYSYLSASSSTGTQCVNKTWNQSHGISHSQCWRKCKLICVCIYCYIWICFVTIIWTLLYLWMVLLLWS